MGEELTFRSAVNGYKKQDVIEYVERKEEELFQLKKTGQEEIRGYKERIQELELQLQKEKEEKQALGERQMEESRDLKEENEILRKNLKELEYVVEDIREKYRKVETEKTTMEEKLGREILRQRAENQLLQASLQKTEKNIRAMGEYEEIRDVVSEAQYKIAEYVNVLNKTQQNLATVYQRMNGIKRRIAEELESMEKEEE